ncbi:MAG: alpha-L-fucosidase [Bacteroidota bacterium]
MRSKHEYQVIIGCVLLLSGFITIAQQPPLPAIRTGKFAPTDESLQQYQYPEWFRDAKFGIWSHWGPQAVPRQGDWYARRMYLSETKDRKTGELKGPDPAYTYHVKHYGHPSKFGYKDIIPLWKAEKWDPEKLMALYKKVGAKYFVSMGSHHDNFFLWNSAIHRWNAVNMGPKKDVVGLWQQAAKKQGLRFGVSEHLAASYTWFQPSHGADKSGPFAGVPYDGADTMYQDLYQTKADANDMGWLTTNKTYQLKWFSYIKELIDNYHPDLLYSDSKMPFDDIGRSMIAHYYNDDIQYHHGELQAVYNCKEASKGKWAEDVERGVKDSISAFPWQTDTSIGDWYYREGQKYMTGTEVIQMLIDIVSKNGNLLLNVVQTPEGDLEPDVMNILEEIAAWTAANGEGIYGTRPWKIYGEGPSTSTAQEKGRFGGLKDVRSYGPDDIRFTMKDNILYAFCMNRPSGNARITSLGKQSKLDERNISAVALVGTAAKLKWKQDNDALIIELPTQLPAWQVLTFKISFK